MKQKLTLSRHTIRRLSDAQLAGVVGGAELPMISNRSCIPPCEPAPLPIPSPPPSFGPPAQCWP